MTPPGGQAGSSGSGYPGSGYPGSGYPGSGGPGSGYPGSGYPGAGGRGNANSAPMDPSAGGSILTTGLMLLGEGESRELLEDAREKGLDVLVMFESEVRQNRAGFVRNDTHIVLFDVPSGEEILKTASLNNITVQKARANKRNDEDPVEVALDNLFEDLNADSGDRSLKLQEFPEAVNSENVKGRITKILDDDDLGKLAVLAEVKCYHAKGLINDATLTKCYQKVLGETDGAKLAQGDEEERVAVLAAFLPDDGSDE